MTQALRMLEAEIERLRTEHPRDAKWWEFRRKAWLDGVNVAHVVGERKLWSIHSAIVDEVGGPEMVKSHEEYSSLVRAMEDMAAAVDGMVGALRRVTDSHRILLDLFHKKAQEAT